jgi:hypothetical protein
MTGDVWGRCVQPYTKVMLDADGSATRYGLKLSVNRRRVCCVAFPMAELKKAPVRPPMGPNGRRDSRVNDSDERMSPVVRPGLPDWGIAIGLNEGNVQNWQSRWRRLVTSDHGRGSVAFRGQRSTNHRKSCVVPKVLELACRPRVGQEGEAIIRTGWRPVRIAVIAMKPARNVKRAVAGLGRGPRRRTHGQSRRRTK